MKIEEFNNSTAGKCIKVIVPNTDGYWAFVPNFLPPKLNYDEKLVNLISEAQTPPGELSGLGLNMHSPYLLIRPYIRKEALASSRIEGTMATMDDSDVYVASEGRSEPGDVKEVINHITALEYGLERLEALPVSTRLMKEIHGELMRGVRGQEKTPGELRTSQNWIGKQYCTLNDAAYVPPPPDKMQTALGKLESYINSDEINKIPLVQCALIHYQFEAIHPFLDGNGRIGRLLITLILVKNKHLSQPLLYLSPYFEQNRDNYYKHLLNISKNGEWNEWIKFFLNGMIIQSRDAINRSKRIIELHRDYSGKLNQNKANPTAYKILEELFQSPAVTIPCLTNMLNAENQEKNLKYTQVKRGVDKLIELNILQQTDLGKKYGNPKFYRAMKILSNIK